ncbi:CpaB family protein [Solicola gregarius]|uniref:SAF domain-containing protein n=1 Tax=Solicola gregarius TaxID=2908642 RepID=A0AA46TF84_9ACTN|nr:hypothetical protein [Solicola gregarius]UYM04055.1 hypothetical protein L0C25_16085 [Solicola gregarius]
MPAPTSPTETAAPPATRLRRPRWSDPRLLVGLLLVCGSIVIGARVMAAADDTTAVWSVATDHRAGTPVDASDLRPVDVRLGDGAERYVAADESVASGRVWSRDVHAGELLGVAATRPVDVREVAQLPLIVSAGSLPSDLATGDRVDVWVSSGPESAESGRAELVLDGMRVLSVVAAPASMGGDMSGYRVLLALEHDRPDRLGPALGAIGAGEVTLVREVVGEMS